MPTPLEFLNPTEAVNLRDPDSKIPKDISKLREFFGKNLSRLGKLLESSCPTRVTSNQVIMAIIASGVFACAEKPNPTSDASFPPDATTPALIDSGQQPDTGTGTTDSGIMDSSILADAGIQDTSIPDALAQDATNPDALVQDTLAPDATTPDATETPDAEATDASGLPDAPAAGNPDAKPLTPDATLAPDASAPDTSAPDASAPDVSAPDASAPDALVPDASTPDASAPDASAPDASAPDASAPDASITDGGTFPPDSATVIIDAGTTPAPDTGIAPTPDTGVHIDDAGNAHYIVSTCLSNLSFVETTRPAPTLCTTNCANSDFVTTIWIEHTTTPTTTTGGTFQFLPPSRIEQPIPYPNPAQLPQGIARISFQQQSIPNFSAIKSGSATEVSQEICLEGAGQFDAYNDFHGSPTRSAVMAFTNTTTPFVTNANNYSYTSTTGPVETLLHIH